MAPRPHRSIPLVACLAASALLGCYEAHTSPSSPVARDGGVAFDGDLPPVDLGPRPDFGVDDAGTPVCQVDYVVTTLAIADPATGVGFDLDDGDGSVGCGTDGPGGVDNALGTLAGTLSGLGVDFNQFLTLGFTLRLIRVTLRTDLCDGSARLAVVNASGDEEGEGMLTLFDPEDDGGIPFEGALSQLPLSLSLPVGPGLQVDLSMDSVRVSGILRDGRMEELVLGGAIEGERLADVAASLGGLVGGLPPDLIEGTLNASLDLETSAAGPGCDALSAAFSGAARALR
jgi:hypothetical protein